MHVCDEIPRAVLASAYRRVFVVTVTASQRRRRMATAANASPVDPNSAAGGAAVRSGEEGATLVPRGA